MLKRFAHQHVEKTWFAFLWFCYLFLRLLNIHKIIEPAIDGDSGGYMHVATLPLFSADFWLGSRPIGLPLFYKILGADTHVYAYAQLGVSIIAWSVFALIVAQSMQKRFMKYCTFFCILVLSLNPEITAWDFWIMSESLSLSFFVLACTAWILLLQKWIWYRVVLVLLTTSSWAVIRDTNAWLLLVAVVFIGVLSIIREKRYMLIAGVLLCTFLYSNTAADRSMRWEYSFYNITAQWILTDTENTKFFMLHGMPLTNELFALAGKWGSSNDLAFYNDPVLEDFRIWVKEYGKDTYRNYLLYNWKRAIGFTVLDFKYPMAFENFRQKFYPQGFVDVFPRFMSNIVYLRLPALDIFNNVLFIVYILFGVSSALYFTLIGSSKHKAVILLPVVLFVLIFPHAFFIKNGDPGGVYRHAIQLSVHIRIALWLLFLFLCDTFNTNTLGRAKQLVVNLLVHQERDTK